MSWDINTNTSALYAAHNLQESQMGLSSSIQRLSSGLRINSSADDPAGLAITDRMTANINGQNQAVRNANDGISMMQTGDSALASITQALQSMRTLAVQASSGTYSSNDQVNLNAQFQALNTQIANIASSTSFNGIKIFGGAAVAIQVGADTQAQSTLSLTTAALQTIAAPGGNISAAATASAALASIDTALQTISSQRAQLGAFQNQLTSIVSNLQTNITNTSAAKAQILDVDYASETGNLSRLQILQNAGTAMLAQANQSTQGVMQLLR